MEEKMIYNKQDGDKIWDSIKHKYPNFQNYEICQCRTSGEYYIDEDIMSKLQNVRTEFNLPMVINSSHRSKEHNKAVGGRPNSEHLKLAYDISLVKPNGSERYEEADLYRLNNILIENGFTTRGVYKTFLHTDTRTNPNRYWIIHHKYSNIFKRVE